jgi:hypothetical protein
MKLGNLKILLLIFSFFNTQSAYAVEEIQSVPLINLEELSATFEEDKDELEKIENQKTNLYNLEKIYKKEKSQKDNKIYINIRALDKITAKTSEIRLAIGEKKLFGPLEIYALKCQLSENNDFVDTVAYLQVKDLSTKNNNQVFLFNGWTFVSSPFLKSIDHPVYDLWITSCENI